MLDSPAADVRRADELHSLRERLAFAKMQLNHEIKLRLIQQKNPGLEITHIHHAGNSSGVVDGAAALLIASPA